MHPPLPRQWCYLNSNFYTSSHAAPSAAAADSPADARLADDGLDPVEEVAVERLLSAELVVDELDLDRLLGRRDEGSLGGSRPESGDEAPGLDTKEKGKRDVACKIRG